MVVFSLQYNNQSAAIGKVLRENEDKLRKAVARLSTGKKFTEPADSPASFSLLSKIASDILIGQQGANNVRNGASMLDTADAGLANIEKIFTDVAVLAQEAMNGVWDNEQRKIFHEQAQSLLTVANDIALSTSFNGIHMLTGSKSKKETSITLQLGSTKAPQDRIVLEFNDMRTATLLKHKRIDLTSICSSQQAMKDVEGALTTIRKEREKMGAYKKVVEYSLAHKEDMNEQLQAIQSTIGDADVAKEMENYTNYTAQVQASQYMYLLSLQNPAKIVNMIQAIK